MDRRQFLSAASALSFIAITDGAGAASPLSASGDWQSVSPSAVGLNAALLEALVKQIRAGEHSNIHSLLVIRHGKLALEEYFTGPDERRDPVLGSKPVGFVRFDANSLHDVRSVTKSVVSILFGIAQSQGLIGDLNQPVMSFFPEYHDLATPERKAIELRHVLSMCPGWEWDEDAKPYGDSHNSETAMDNSADPYRYVLERKIIAPPGQKFQYDGGTTLLVGAIVERATKMRLEQYAEKVLFHPLGIARYEWIKYENGKVIPASGLRLRPRDLASIAQLYLQKGQWDSQVVPESWVRTSTTPQAAGGFYGFQWWVGASGEPFGASGRWAMALGYGGQRTLICPALDLVAVATAGLYNDRQQSKIVHKVLRQCVDAIRPPMSARS